jgi:antitoxin component of RelBE/YafQ-DinJ toxin-antitoxin module
MPRVLVTPSPAPIPSVTVDSAPPPERCKSPPSLVPRAATTRKIDIRVNALERQEEALIDCGVDPAHVIRAALRRAVRNWQLGLDFVPPSEEQRTRITEWRTRTSLAVDTEALAALLRAHDPLDVLSKWTLIRGQVEPRVWAEIDTILDEIAGNAAVPREGGDR